MLKQIPTIAHLSRMYFELARYGAACVGKKSAWPYEPKRKEELVALACDMSRFDPRLVDILVDYFSKHWMVLNPVAMRGLYKTMNTPQTVAVICEFAGGGRDNDELKYFCEYLTKGLMPAPTQFYFHHLYAPGGGLAARAVEEGLYEYKKWGFLACERPTLDIWQKKTAGSLKAPVRKNILRRLLEERPEVSLKDYLEALHNSISRQQALLDIKASGFAVSVGAGRGARWKKAA